MNEGKGRDSKARAPQLQRAESWEVVATSLLPGRKTAPLESQMNAMFGGDLFRERTRIQPAVKHSALRPPQRIGGAFVKMLLLAIAVGAVAFGAAAQRVKRSRELVSLRHDLAGYLRTGELRHADEAMERALMLADPQQAKAMAPLLARTEATLYRYVDSSAERRSSAERWLKTGGEGTFDATIARALITPDSELSGMQAVLRAIAIETRDAEATHLFGVSLDAAGRRKDAGRAFNRALDLEPSHLPHLAHYAVWMTREGRASEAGDLIDQMKTIDPESPWIAWVEEEIR
jgi:Tfp pilus assembly protein PilF